MVEAGAQQASWQALDSVAEVPAGASESGCSGDMDHLIVRLGAGSIGLASARQTARRSDRPPGQMYGRVRRGAPGSPRRRESRPCGRVPSPPPPQLSCGSGHNPGGRRGGKTRRTLCRARDSRGIPRFGYRVVRRPELAPEQPKQLWAQEDLNLRPLPCQGSALPLSYAPFAATEGDRRQGSIAPRAGIAVLEM